MSEATQPGTVTPPRRSTSWRRKLVYALIPLLVVTLATEILGRCIAYQRLSNHTLAIFGLFDAVKDWQRDSHVEAVRRQLREDQAAEEARRDRAARSGELESKERYTEIFEHFVERCRAADATLALLFVPGPGGPKYPLNVSSRAFFRELCAKRDLPLLDATAVFEPHAREVVYLLPDDGHTSRFGNHLLAEALASFLRPLLQHRSKIHFTDAERPALLGDLAPSKSYIFWDSAPLPCRVITDAQGLRRLAELEFPKSRPRVLCVGDSYTFGHGVHNSQCYPQQLEALLGGVDVVNGGIAGYTICDEYSYFVERGRFTEPDVVLLQVFPNDFEDLRPSMQKVFCRGGEFCAAPGDRR